ncbi:MAG: SigB/SigF/SigG family RNA polymerase sigma factor [Acidimicrobiales bacterium]
MTAEAAGSAPAPSPNPGERFVEYRRTRSRRLRNELVEANAGLAAYFARRYAQRGVALDDLTQVAMLALLNAVERFDPDRGVKFATFAGRTIDGEMKRFFRDRTWSLRVPRRSKELHLAMRTAAERLTHEQGRPPTIAELAAALEVDADEVVEAIDAGAAYRTASLDQPGDDEQSAAPRSLAAEGGYGEVDSRVLIERLLAQLPERERTIIELRFFGELSQAEIAEKVGVSQMHVSRLIRRTLGELRELLDSRSGLGS